MSTSQGIVCAVKTREPIAASWHTVLVLVLLGIASIASAYQQGLPNANVPGISLRLSGYFTVLAFEWFLVLLIWLALRRRGLSLGALVSGRWQTPSAFLIDLGLAVGFTAVVVPLAAVLAYLIRGNPNSTVAQAHITPKTGFELAVWLALSATGGFCEELVFRGYLTQQFRAWTGSRAFAIVLQGVAFGLAHGYYRKIMIVVIVHGCLLGLLAHWRKSLRPGMLAHVLQDFLGGTLAFFSGR
jgi:membrane protease YdiL (CAAX protease family)